MNSKTSKRGLPGVTFHAQSRYRARVDELLDDAGARAEIKRILATGQRHGPGRGKWAGHVRLEPGCMLIEDPLDPRVALIVGHGVVMTVVTDRLTGATEMEEGDGYAQRS